MRIIFPFISIISIISITSISCKKEAIAVITTDTLKVARIFQPDAIPGNDAVIESIFPDQNFGSDSFFTIFSWTNSNIVNNARALIKFDLTEIPSYTSIKSAKLLLFWNAYENLKEHTGENAFTIYRINQSWDESTVTWNNQPTITNLDSISVPKSIFSDQSYTVDVTSIVQNMIRNPITNYGFMLRLNVEFPFHLAIMASSDNADRSKHPKLTVYY